MQVYRIRRIFRPRQQRLPRGIHLVSFPNGASLDLADNTFQGRPLEKRTFSKTMATTTRAPEETITEHSPAMVARTRSAASIVAAGIFNTGLFALRSAVPEQ
jgi:hypothetical protein